ncbi:hypothetical protein AWB91_09565 [Mycobacterium paraense]|uniref:VOC domain-containing protein n=1 Tax=Mycobacterium paraense TaxID=767916 RepID=A0ABX3VR19_9MYCO|nr:hypothetical protein AWB91_09565 [Mycobacterium paraense]ORW44954.1 hypothetical protein AWB88_04635 [Mycobacterium paraense]
MRTLGYVVITAEDLAAWKSFAERVLGLQLNQSMGTDVADVLHFRMDGWDWRIAVEQGADGGLSALGFEVGDRAGLEKIRAYLSEWGVPVKDVPELAARRHVMEIFQAEDPDGNVIEFFYGGRRDRMPFVSPRGARFVTGAQGLGHAVLWVSDAKRSEHFYTELLGFRLTDVVTMGPMTLYFTSPNARHHTVAYGPRPAGIEAAMQHILLEVDDLDMVGRALDRAYDAGAPVIANLGRHTNDRMVSFYCSSPSGLLIEYGWGGRVIDDDACTTELYSHASEWGHRPPDGSNPHPSHEVED